MPFMFRASVASVALALCTTASHAASGTLNSFSASASQVNLGSWVDFSVEFSLSAEAETLTGGSDPTEPAPQEGDQEWVVNWYSRTWEMIGGVSLQAGGQSFNDAPAVAPGSGYTGRWEFSLYFDQPGTHSVALTGDWFGDAYSEYGAEVATRNCYGDDPEISMGLSCDSWRWSYPGGVPDNFSIGGQFAAQSIDITVLAAPEPGTVPLWLSRARGMALSGCRAASAR